MRGALCAGVALALALLVTPASAAYEFGASRSLPPRAPRLPLSIAMDALSVHRA